MLTKTDLQSIKKVIKEVALTKEDAKTLATKDDLKTLVTKEDAKNFATKDELKTLVTKEDAKTLATKDELKGLASKDDLKQLEKRLDKKFTDLFNFLDKDIMENQRRLKRVENALNLPSLQ